MARKKVTRYQMAAMIHDLNRRRLEVWIPLLEEKVAQRQARIEEKQGQEAGSGAGAQPGETRPEES